MEAVAEVGPAMTAMVLRNTNVEMHPLTSTQMVPTVLIIEAKTGSPKVVMVVVPAVAVVVIPEDKADKFILVMQVDMQDNAVVIILLAARALDKIVSTTNQDTPMVEPGAAEMDKTAEWF